MKTDNKTEAVKLVENMNVLNLTLKRKWFDMVSDPNPITRKGEEYREIKLYWAQRLCGSSQYNGNDRGLLPNDKSTYWNGFYPLNFKKFDAIKFTNGYSKTSPTVTLQCLGIEIGTGKTEWGAEEGKKYFVIRLGNIINKNF